MSIFGIGGGPGDRLSFTEGGHHRPSPRGRRRGCAGGARGVLEGGTLRSGSLGARTFCQDLKIINN